MNYTFSDRISGVKPSAIREILKMSSDRSVIALSAGNPAPEAFPVEEIRRITRELLQEDPILALQYSVTEGYTPLREALKELMRGRYGALGAEDDLIVVSGAQQGVEMACKVFCNEGDTVIAEDPSFVGALNAFRSYNVNMVGVPLEEDGISVEKLAAALSANPNTKLIYLIPNFQNPSGITMSMEKREAVYGLARRYDVAILEDNPYGDLRYSGEDVPSIKTLDTDGRVIYCGSFSKLVAPGLRVGYISANREIISKLVVAKQCTDVHTAILPQLICEKFLRECDLVAHIEQLRGIYRAKCALMIKNIEAHFSPRVAFTRPRGGLFLWCTLPEGSDMVEFCRVAAADYKVAVVPGSAFTVDPQTPTTSFRANFSTPSDEDIVRGIEILGKLTYEFIR